MYFGAGAVSLGGGGSAGAAFAGPVELLSRRKVYVAQPTSPTPASTTMIATTTATAIATVLRDLRRGGCCGPGGGGKACDMPQG